jgi:hypothetical protein
MITVKIRLEYSDKNIYLYHVESFKTLDINIGEIYTMKRGDNYDVYKVVLIEKINNSNTLKPFIQYNEVLVTVKKLHLYKYEEGLEHEKSLL